MPSRPAIVRAFYAQPESWAISASQDLTATLRLHSDVNPLIGGEYRTAFWCGEDEIETT